MPSSNWSLLCLFYLFASFLTNSLQGDNPFTVSTVYWIYTRRQLNLSGVCTCVWHAPCCTCVYETVYWYPPNLRSEAHPLSFQIEFLFDSLAPCQITIFQSIPDSFTMDMIANGWALIWIILLFDGCCPVNAIYHIFSNRGPGLYFFQLVFHPGL